MARNRRRRNKNGCNLGRKSGRAEAKKLKAQLIIERGHKCEVPGCEWTYTVEIHHIDDDRTHNTRRNCILICPNHHSLTPSNRKPTDYSIVLTAEFFRKILSDKFGYKYSNPQVSISADEIDIIS
jgi:hypothetical protein